MEQSQHGKSENMMMFIDFYMYPVPPPFLGNLYLCKFKSKSINLIYKFKSNNQTVNGIRSNLSVVSWVYSSDGGKLGFAICTFDQFNGTRFSIQ